jgi:hypothetical protein
MAWLTDSDRPTLSIAEVAEVLGESAKDVKTACHNGTLPSLLIGKEHVIPRLPLLALLNVVERPVQPKPARVLVDHWHTSGYELIDHQLDVLWEVALDRIDKGPTTKKPTAEERHDTAVRIGDVLQTVGKELRVYARTGRV